MPRVRDRLAALGLAPSKARGQNFLRNPTTATAILDRLELSARDRAIEIGPGLGDLTRPLAGRVERVVALEVDRGLVRLLEEEGLPANVELRLTDALDVDLVALARDLGSPSVLIGNLPYSISGKLLARLLLGLAAVPPPEQPIRVAGFMLQAEVADRLWAEPGSSAYGSLSVWARLVAPARRLLELGPDAFVPRPKVRSSFVCLEPARAARTHEPLDVETLERLVRAAFGQRRKTLRRALHGSFEQVDRALERAGIDGGRRGETLSELEFVALATALAATGRGERAG